MLVRPTFGFLLGSTICVLLVNGAGAVNGRALHRARDVGSVIDSITSDFASDISQGISIATSIAGGATSDVGGIISTVRSDAGSIVSDAMSKIVSVLSQPTTSGELSNGGTDSAPTGVNTSGELSNGGIDPDPTATNTSGELSNGGDPTPTSPVGTGTFTSPNSGLGMRTLIQAPLLGGLVAVLGSVILGTMVAA